VSPGRAGQPTGAAGASARPTFVIVGANLTGGAAVTALRERGFDGRIVMIGAEAHPPYERPPLSKALLRGETTFDDALLHPLEWYDENDVELLLSTRVARLETADRTVRLEDGRTIAYDRVLVATGCRNRDLDVPGRTLDGVFDLRTYEDAERLRGRALRGGTAAVVGAGFIGCEVTASLRALGVAIEVIDPGAVPLLRVLGSEVGAAIEALHRDHGVRFHPGQGVARFDGGPGGSVERVVTTTGEEIGCDFAVVGVGVQPVTDVVDGTDVTIDNGIVTDAFLRTNVPDVFAAGDVANHDDPVFGRHLRVEHWENALKGGAVAAHNMLGEGVAYDEPHWFWSDQYDAEIQYGGFAATWDALLVRGSIEERSFLAFYVDAGIVRGVVGMNRGSDVRRCLPLVKAARPVDPEDLLDEDVDPKALVARVGAARPDEVT
jgi:3-phenylpropionate/trans-cinnamate dioxygenase ferredoxin reductase subunit